MPSIFRYAAVAALAVLASAQNSTTNGTSAVAPVAAAVAGWTYVGCRASTGAPGVLRLNSPTMTEETCDLACSAYDYAGVSGPNCFCAMSLNGTSPVAESACSTKCPGNPAEACGGPAIATKKRQAAGTVLSYYQRQLIVPVGVVYETIINNYYIDLCCSCLGGTTSVAYASVATVTGCGCATPSIPSIAMSTAVVTTLISAASGSTTATVTLTLPSGVAVGSQTPAAAVTTVAAVSGTTVIAASTTLAAATSKFTGAAAQNMVGAGLAIAAGVAAFAL